MNNPDLSRIAETFIRVARRDADPRAVWTRHIQLLRSRVAPLVRDLRNRRYVGWYSFLFHDRCSGVPPSLADDGAFIHLRLELAEGVTVEHLKKALPPECEGTDYSPSLAHDRLDEIDASSLRDRDVAEAWRILGELSEWSLSMLEAHTDGLPVPPQNIRKFFHFLRNQLLAGFIGCPDW